jgi:hypothetical protein
MYVRKQLISRNLRSATPIPTITSIYRPSRTRIAHRRHPRCIAECQETPRMSQAGRKLAQDVQAAIQNPPYRDLFDFRPSAGPAPLLLILGKLPSSV